MVICLLRTLINQSTITFTMVSVKSGGLLMDINWIGGENFTQK